MSSCNVWIEIDHEDQCYKIGETINGTVYVSVDEAVQCNGLTIDKFWFSSTIKAINAKNEIKRNTEPMTILTGCSGNPHGSESATSGSGTDMTSLSHT